MPPDEYENRDFKELRVNGNNDGTFMLKKLPCEPTKWDKFVDKWVRPFWWAMLICFAGAVYGGIRLYIDLKPLPVVMKKQRAQIEGLRTDLDNHERKNAFERRQAQHLLVGISDKLKVPIAPGDTMDYDTDDNQ